ncbi:Peptidyl-prolyl cis-trans isomerase [Frankliniella fusca]|uniref:Peptidyl-prolyl cis-trans isomerase n=1 Tax=Frankliniella fusca TaxID=407009 RepID=A0AAE1LJY6_9NEOP|nr:Peptidyl-prolyl cis-trans isomerase [Frankliniella fusca]
MDDHRAEGEAWRGISPLVSDHFPCKMENHSPAGSVRYDQKEYTEIILNSSTENPESENKSPKNPNTVYVSSLDEDDNETPEECHHLCEEIEIPQTSPSVSLYDTYVSKTVLTPGLVGLRPHFHSVCKVFVEETILLNPAFEHVLEGGSVFSRESSNRNTITIRIGSSDTELERALELALLNMNVAERSEVILSASDRTKKLRDKPVLPAPCVKCIINLKAASTSCDTNMEVAGDSSLACLSSNEEEKYETALNDKNSGIELFKKQKFVDAFHRFAAGAKTLMTLDSIVLEGKERNEEISTLYSTLCSNMAECQLKENNPTSAMILCKRALEHDPCNVKALYRQAVAAWTLGDVDQADSLLIHLLQLDPNNLAAKRIHKEVKDRLQIYEDEYSTMMKRIFGNNN